jgi:hypothetical protein
VVDLLVRALLRAELFRVEARPRVAILPAEWAGSRV